MEIFVAALTIFLLALFVGYEMITKVPPLLHTPLMSGGQCNLGHHAGGYAGNRGPATDNFNHDSWPDSCFDGYSQRGRRFSSDPSDARNVPAEIIACQ